ncbi:MAG: glycosyltransferase family 4 protein [Deltaproteobacteria bacterium]|nr:glycosyltransferase family 4 protein [Deltaproteobacteria bacterium]
MRIAFAPSSMLQVSPQSLESRPLGGMETALLRLSEAIGQAGHEVILLTEERNPRLTEPLLLPYTMVDRLGELDAVISVREWTPLLLPFQSKLRLFWTGDSYDLAQNIGIGDARVINKIDHLLCVSNWHAHTLSSHSGFPAEKIYILRNGLHLPYFEGSETRLRKRLIYSSTPYRGLNLLKDIYSDLVKNHSDLELHVFSGYQVYSQNEKNDFHPKLVREFEALSREMSQLPGCVMHGNVIQKALAREMMRSSILAYPNTFEETSCITAMEAQAAGCVVVTSELGALPETVGDRGVIVKGKPGSPEYMQEFKSQLNRLLTDDGAWNALSSASLAAAKQFSWKAIAEEFIKFIGHKVGA